MFFFSFFRFEVLPSCRGRSNLGVLCYSVCAEGWECVQYIFVYFFLLSTFAFSFPFYSRKWQDLITRCLGRRRMIVKLGARSVEFFSFKRALRYSISFAYSASEIYYVLWSSWKLLQVLRDRAYIFFRLLKISIFRNRS